MTKPTTRTSFTRLAVEGALIVVSILLALAIEAWWASSQDREREVVYLEQLEADLEGTLENSIRFGGQADASELATVRLFRAYYEASVPPPDSLRAWWIQLAGLQVQPRLGTVQALVSTGDLELITDDSLRVAIPSYLTDMTAYDGFEASGANLLWGARIEITRHVDPVAVRTVDLSAATRDSLTRADPWAPVPIGAVRQLPAVDLTAAVRDPEVHRILGVMRTSQATMRAARGAMRSRSEELLALVRQVRSNDEAGAR